MKTMNMKRVLKIAFIFLKHCRCSFVTRPDKTSQINRRKEIVEEPTPTALSESLLEDY